MRSVTQTIIIYYCNTIVIMTAHNLFSHPVSFAPATAVRVVPIWNSLPLNLVTSPTEAILKRSISKHNLSNHLT